MVGIVIQLYELSQFFLHKKCYIYNIMKENKFYFIDK